VEVVGDDAAPRFALLDACCVFGDERDTLLHLAARTRSLKTCRFLLLETAAATMLHAKNADGLTPRELAHKVRFNNIVVREFEEAEEVLTAKRNKERAARHQRFATLGNYELLCTPASTSSGGRRRGWKRWATVQPVFDQYAYSSDRATSVGTVQPTSEEPSPPSDAWRRLDDTVIRVAAAPHVAGTSAAALPTRSISSDELLHARPVAVKKEPAAATATRRRKRKRCSRAQSWPPVHVPLTPHSYTWRRRSSSAWLAVRVGRQQHAATASATAS
jgi:hypothetical protein